MDRCLLSATVTAACLLAISLGSAGEPGTEPPRDPEKQPAIRIFQCEHVVMMFLPVPRDPDMRMTSFEQPWPWMETPIRKTWIEIYLPENGLACRYGTTDFFEANDDRYQPKVKVPAAKGLPKGTMPKPTHVTELTDMTLTDEAMARLKEALEKYTESQEEKVTPKGDDPAKVDDTDTAKGVKPPELFALISIGMNRSEVENLLGKHVIIGVNNNIRSHFWYLPAPKIQPSDSPCGPGAIMIEYANGKVFNKRLNTQGSYR